MAEFKKLLDLTTAQRNEVNSYLKQLNASDIFRSNEEMARFILENNLQDKGQKTIKTYISTLKLKANEMQVFKKTLKEQVQPTIKALKKIGETDTTTINADNLKKIALTEKLQTLDLIVKTQAEIIASTNNRNIQTIEEFKQQSKINKYNNAYTLTDKLLKEQDLAEIQRLSSQISKEYPRTLSGTQAKTEASRLLAIYENYTESTIKPKMLKTYTYETQRTADGGFNKVIKETLEYESTKDIEATNILIAKTHGTFGAFEKKYTKGVNYTDKYLIKFLKKDFEIYTFTFHWLSKTGGGLVYNHHYIATISLKFKDIIDSKISKAEMFKVIHSLLGSDYFKRQGLDSEQEIAQISELLGQHELILSLIMKKELKQILTKNNYKAKNYGKLKEDYKTVTALLNLGATFTDIAGITID